MPVTSSTATTTTAIATPNHRLNGFCFLPASFGRFVCPPICFFSSVCCDIVTPQKFCLVLLLRLGYLFARTLQKAEKCWDKKQRGNRSEQKSTYNRTPKWRILFPTVSHSERHGHHADDHGQSGHQHRPKPRETGLQCGADGVAALLHFFCRKAHYQDAVGGCHAHTHDRSHECGHAESRVRYKQKPRDPGKRSGQRGNHNERIQPRLKVDHDQQINQHDGEHQSTQKTNVGRSHGLHLSTNNDSRTTG